MVTAIIGIVLFICILLTMYLRIFRDIDSKLVHISFWVAILLLLVLIFILIRMDSLANNGLMELEILLKEGAE